MNGTAKGLIEGVMDGFNPSEPVEGAELKGGQPLTIWVQAGYKARYDRIQAASGRRFSKKMRELIQAAIDMTEPRAS